MLMSVSLLKTKADLLKAAFAERDENRRLWKDETKARLLAVLQQIAKETKLGLQVQDADWTDNAEAVGLVFSVMPSGLVEIKGDMVDAQAANSLNQERTHLLKHGGYLNFSQNYNGSLFVYIGYPYVDKRIPQAESKPLGQFSPREVTEAFIREQAVVFLTEMVEWELRSSSQRIGFVFDKKRK
jgi:hypothetical protein